MHSDLREGGRVTVTGVATAAGKVVAEEIRVLSIPFRPTRAPSPDEPGQAER